MPTRTESSNTQANTQHSSLLSYASSSDPLLKRFLIRAIEQLSGARLLEKLYIEILSEGLRPDQLWSAALDKLQIKLEYDRQKLTEIGLSEDKLVFIANHPYGVVDGLIFGMLISQIRPDFVMPVNDLLSRVQELSDYFLPINFEETREALRTNIATRQQIMKRIDQGTTLGIFPAGGVATAHTLWGPGIELEWKRFTAKIVDVTRATVIPIYFHGENSRFFHWASRVSMTLRLALLLHEVRNKIGKTIRISIGDPVPYGVLEKLSGRQQRLDYLLQATLALGEPQAPAHPKSLP